VVECLLSKHKVQIPVPENNTKHLVFLSPWSFLTAMMCLVVCYHPLSMGILLVDMNLKVPGVLPRKRCMAYVPPPSPSAPGPQQGSGPWAGLGGGW
jgi:hypothetical protein